MTKTAATNAYNGIARKCGAIFVLEWSYMKYAASFSAGRLTVYLSGELDHHEAGGVIRTIDELIEDNMPRECAIDLSDLRFMDSSGIAVIISAGRKMRTLGGRVIVENPQDQARKVLETSGIERLIAVGSHI